MTCNECGGDFTQGILHVCGSEVARLRAEVERLTRERNEVMAGFGPVALEAADLEVDRLRAEVERLQRHADGQAEVLKATVARAEAAEARVKVAREEGAEAMREADAEHLSAIATNHAKIGNTFTMPKDVRGAAKQKARFFAAAAKEVRALPLSGAKEGP